MSNHRVTITICSRGEFVEDVAVYSVVIAGEETRSPGK